MWRGFWNGKAQLNFCNPMAISPILKIFFFIFLSFIGFCTGMFIASFFIDKDTGLAGPADALLYGIAGMIAVLITGIALARRMKLKTFRIAFAFTFVLSLALAAWIVYRVQVVKQRPSGFSPDMNYKNEETASLYSYAAAVENEDDQPAGMGIAKPHLSDGHVIYFYHLLPIDMQAWQVRPMDSIVIRKGKNHFEISYAPPWFFPEVIKLDYDLLLLRTLAIAQDWMEVVVNKQTELTCWISRSDAEFTDWPTFLLGVYAVELINPQTNPLRLKPLDHANIVATATVRFPLKPLAIKGDWAMVPTLGLAGRIVPNGWIRWRKNDRLLVKYSLLS